MDVADAYKAIEAEWDRMVEEMAEVAREEVDQGADPAEAVATAVHNIAGDGCGTYATLTAIVGTLGPETILEIFDEYVRGNLEEIVADEL